MSFNLFPTVGLGPLAGNLAQNGFHDDWVDIPDFIRAVKITPLLSGPRIMLEGELEDIRLALDRKHQNSSGAISYRL